MGLIREIRYTTGELFTMVAATLVAILSPIEGNDTKTGIYVSLRETLYYVFVVGRS